MSAEQINFPLISKVNQIESFRALLLNNSFLIEGLVLFLHFTFTWTLVLNYFSDHLQTHALVQAVKHIAQKSNVWQLSKLHIFCLFCWNKAKISKISKYEVNVFLLCFLLWSHTCHCAVITTSTATWTASFEMVCEAVLWMLHFVSWSSSRRRWIT